MTLAAGDLVHRVAVGSPDHAERDPGSGAVLTAWHFEFLAWARIKPVSVRDFVAADALQSKVDAHVVMRAATAAPIRAGWRLVHGAAVYTVAGVLPDADTGRDYVTLACATGVVDG